jgi:spermidine synthase
MADMEYVEVARAASERGEVVLRRRCDPLRPESPAALELRVNGVFVMDTLESSSEIELARAALAGVAAPRRVLIGGLGLGYTAHEVLSDPRVEDVVVAEIEEALVRWFRDGTIAHGRPYLADRRVHVAVAPVQQVVAEARPASYDVVLLDVDNGPDFLVHDDNAAIYEAEFLTLVRRALRPGGRLAVWSSTRSAPLERRLVDSFGSCEVRELPVHLQDREESYWLHLATVPGS